MISGLNCTFDELEHGYWQDSVRIISATQVLEQVGLIDLEGISKYVLDHAAERGTYVHSCCEVYCSGELDMDGVHPEAAGYVKSFIDWLTISGFKVHRWGKPRVVTLNGSRYGMTEDFVGILHGEPWVIDLKTPTELQDSVPIQLAAYAAGLGTCCIANGEMLEMKFGAGMAVIRIPDLSAVKMVPYKRGALQVFADGSCGKLTPFDDPVEESVWLSALVVATWSNNRK